MTQAKQSYSRSTINNVLELVKHRSKLTQNLWLPAAWPFNEVWRKGLKDWIPLKEIGWPQLKSSAQ